MTKISIRSCKNCLSHLALDPANSLGRRRQSVKNSGREDLVNPFISDTIRLLDSKALRRLAAKAQIFPNPDDPHVRTRRIHTDEVVATSLLLADLLGLNKELCQAIALGHDIGHTVYGHWGEKVLSKLLGKPFEHRVFAVILAQRIERKGNGLNLTWETLQGILNHSGGKDLPEGSSQEAELVRLADKITFTFSDLQDLRRFGMGVDDLPKILWEFGSTQREQMGRCVYALVRESAEKGKVSFVESVTAQRFEELKRWPYREIYEKLDTSFNEAALEKVCAFLEHYFRGCDPRMLLALLTDVEAEKIATLTLKHPNYWGLSKEDVHTLRLGVEEIAVYMKGRDIDLTDPDLNWGKPVGKP